MATKIKQVTKAVKIAAVMSICFTACVIMTIACPPSVFAVWDAFLVVWRDAAR